MENAHKLTDKIRTMFAGTEAELEREIQQFNARRAEKKTELEDKEDVLQTEQYEYSEMSKKFAEHDRKCHSLTLDRQREQDLHAQKAKYVKNMCTKLNVNVTFDIDNFNERANELVTEIKSEMTKIDGKIKEMIAHNEREDEKLEKEIRKYSEDGSRVEAEIVQITSRLKELKATLAQQSDELRKIERSSNRLKEVQTAIEHNKKKHDELVAKTDSQGTRAQIAESRAEKQELSDELEGVDMQITELSTMATLLAQISAKQKQLEEKEADARRITNKHRDSLERLLPNDNIGVGIKAKIEHVNQEVRIKTNRLEAEIRLKENQITVSKSQQHDKSQQIEKLEAELRRLEGEINRACDSKPFDECLATVKEDVDKHQMEYSELKSSDVFFKKYAFRLFDLAFCMRQY